MVYVGVPNSRGFASLGCLLIIYLARKAGKIQSKIWYITFLILAVIDNPIFRLHLTRAEWIIIDIITLVLMLASIPYIIP